MSKVAIIGLGPMGVRHIQACEDSSLLQLVGGTDLNEARIEQLCSEGKLPARGGFTDYKEMIVQLKPEIVVIATNGPSHYTIFHDVVKLGVKKILCEKPIAVSVEQGRDMIRTASVNGVLLLVNHIRRWSLDYQKLKSALEEGAIGKIESVQFTMGGGQLGCNGTHIFDLISFLTGARTAKVLGFLNDEGIPNPRGEQFYDPGGYALVHMNDGTRVYFEMTEDLGIPPLLILNGTYGRITIEETKRRMTIEKRTLEDRSLPVTRYGTALKDINEIRIEHLDVVKLTRIGLEGIANGILLADPSEALSALEVIVSIHASHQANHSPMELPITDSTIIEKVFSFT